MNSWKTSFDVRKQDFLQALYENCVQKAVRTEVNGYGKAYTIFLGWVKSERILTATDNGNRLEQGGSFFISKGIQKNGFRTRHVLSRSCVRGYNEHLISPYEIPIHTAYGCGLYPGEAPLNTP